MFTVKAIVQIPFLGDEEMEQKFDAPTAWDAAAAAMLYWDSVRPVEILSVERVTDAS